MAGEGGVIFPYFQSRSNSGMTKLQAWQRSTILISCLFNDALTSHAIK